MRVGMQHGIRSTNWRHPGGPGCVCAGGGGGDAIFKRKACMGPGVSAQRRGPVPKRMSDVKPS